MIIVLAPKTLPKHAQNHSKTTQQNIPKTHQKSTPKLTDFGIQMTPKMSTKILHKSTWGALWDHMGPLETQKGGRDPPGNQKGGPRPLWGTILITFGYYFECFSIIFTTAFRLCRTIFASINIMPTLASPATTQTATNQKGAGGRGEAFRSAALGLPRCRA